MTNPDRSAVVRTDEGLKLSDNLIPTLSAARSVYMTYRTEHLKRIELYSAIEGLIAGNPPYNPVELKRMGLSHIANFNNLDGRSLYERGALAYWNLLNEAENLIVFELKGVPAEYTMEWADILARNWSNVVREWPSFYTQMCTLSSQIVKFGLSPVVWSDERDWRWRTVEVSRFFVADQTQCDISQLTSVYFESLYTIQELWQIYTESKKHADSPWDTKALEDLIVHRAGSYFAGSNVARDMMDIQRKIQNGDLHGGQLLTDSVRLVSLLQQEYDGSISSYIFDRDYDTADFLYKNSHQYKNLNEAMILFTASPGEFTIHSNVGLGHKIFAGCQATMQLDCSIVDASRWASTPLLKSLAQGSRDFETIRFYPGVPTHIGTSEFVQNNMGANIQQLVGASQYVMSKIQWNTANSGDDPSQPDRNLGSISPSQARMMTYKEFSVLKQNIAHFYNLYDGVVKNMTSKMLSSKRGYPGYEYAEEWRTRCLEEGVPKEIFSTREENSLGSGMPRHLRVRATRVAGDGSTLARIMGLQELASLVPTFSPKGQREYQRQMITASAGKESVMAFMSPEQPDEISGGASLAGVENVAMKSGESAIFSPENEQRAHVAIHFALANNIVNATMQRQMDSVAADKVFTVLIPHLEEHISYMAQNPFYTAFLNQIKKPWDELMNYAMGNRKAAAQAIQSQIDQRQKDTEETERVLSEEERKNVQAENDERRKDLKVISQVERAGRANETRAEVMREKVQKDAEIKRLAVQLNHRAKVEQASSQAKQSDTFPENANEKEAIKAESEAELRSRLTLMKGNSISPYDIENPENV